MTTNRVFVAGGGVTAVTTALVLKLFGYDVTIGARDWSHEERAKSNRAPDFASVHGVASILTHSVSSPNLKQWLGTSQEVYQLLQAFASFGVRKQRHFEVFEDREQAHLPPYADIMHNFQRLPESGQGVLEAPRRTGAERIWGWHFDCFFVEMSHYLQTLFAVLKDLGGKFETVSLSEETLPRTQSEYDLVVNALGAGSGRIFGATSPEVFVRGALVSVEAPLPVERYTRQLVSYNYKPAAGLYQTTTGTPVDLYFYPRADGGLCLGGTREEGRNNAAPGERMRWVGERMDCEYIEVAGVEVPKPMIDFNADIIQRLTGVDISGRPMSADYGIRYTFKSGLEVKLRKTGAGPIVDNTGHGGSGVTLSWGCALAVLNLVQSSFGVGPALLSTADRVRSIQLLQGKLVELQA